MDKPTIRLTNDGLQLTHGDKITAEISWSNVTKIITYKYDNFTTDEICVAFRTWRESDAWLEVSEEWLGFSELMKVMKQRFPEINSGWYMAVMQPPFERRETVLWPAPESSSQP